MTLNGHFSRPTETDPFVLSHYYIDVYELQLLRQILETRVKSRMLFTRFLKDT